MARTKLQRKADIKNDPCKNFRVILKSYMYDDEHHKVFTNNDIAEWTCQSVQNVSEKMNGKRDFKFREIRTLVDRLGFTTDEKLKIFL